MSPLASRPTGTQKKLSTLTIPRSRQELVAQYPKQSYDIERLLRSKSPKLSSYKKDAALLLTSSLKKHYNKFFYIWRKHAKDLKKEMIRREALRSSGRTAFLTPPVPKSPQRRRSDVESQLSYAYSETRKRSGLISPTSLESESIYVRLKPHKPTIAIDTSFTVRKDLPPRAVTGFSADLYSDPLLEERRAMSHVSRRDVVTETSPLITPASDASGHVIKLVFALAVLLQRRKQMGIVRMKAMLRKNEAARRMYGALYRRIQMRKQVFFYTLLLGRPTPILRNVLPLILCLHRTFLRPVWETLRLETIKSMISQLFHLSFHRLHSLYLSRLHSAFTCLQVSLVSPLPRKPAITLKTILHIILMHRLQVSFNATRRFGEVSEKRIVTARMKLRRCFQVCEVARVKVMAKYFNRFRKSKKRIVRQGKSGRIAGAKVTGQIVEQARTRRLREGVKEITGFARGLVRRNAQLNAAPRLLSLISEKIYGQVLELFLVFRMKKRTDRILRKGRRVLNRMIRMYCKDSAILLRTAYHTWKQLKLLRNPLLSSPEIPMFVSILQGLISRREELGLDRLKQRLFGEIDYMESDKKAAVLAIGLSLTLALQSALRASFHLLKKDEQTLTPRAITKLLDSRHRKPTSSHQRKAKIVAVKLIGKWEAAVLQRRVALSFRQFQEPIRLAKGVNRLEKVEKRLKVRRWLRTCGVKKQLERGVELLQLCIHKKLEQYFTELRPEDSGSSFLDAYAQIEVAPNQALSLRLCLDKLHLNHLMTEVTAWERWKSRNYQSVLQRKADLLGGVVRLVHTIRAKTVLLENAAFHLLSIR